MSIDRFVDLVLIVFFVCCLGLVFYAALKLQQLRAESMEKTIKLKDDEIAKEINSMPLSDVVSANNKSQDPSSSDGKS